MQKHFYIDFGVVSICQLRQHQATQGPRHRTFVGDLGAYLVDWKVGLGQRGTGRAGLLPVGEREGSRHTVSVLGDAAPGGK